MKAVQAVLMAALVMTCVGCGWQLRGWQNGQLPDELYLVTDHRFAPMSLAMIDAMDRYNVNHRGEAAMQLRLGDEVLSRRTVAATSIGSAAQFELALSVEFYYQLRSQDQPYRPQTLTTTRVFDFDPNNAIAKIEEENILLNEMRRELAFSILQQAPSPESHGSMQP